MAGLMRENGIVLEHRDDDFLDAFARYAQLVLLKARVETTILVSAVLEMNLEAAA